MVHRVSGGVGGHGQGCHRVSLIRVRRFTRRVPSRPWAPVTPFVPRSGDDTGPVLDRDETVVPCDGVVRTVPGQWFRTLGDLTGRIIETDLLPQPPGRTPGTTGPGGPPTLRWTSRS